jgi:four helix bundle protein
LCTVKRAVLISFLQEKTMHNIKELKIWQKSIDLVVEVYKATEKFPREETYGLTSQIRRSSVSIASNIAEGAGRNSNPQFVQFLGISNGSSYELQTQVIISNKLGLMKEEIMKSLLGHIEENQKMNYRLQRTLKEK